MAELEVELLVWKQAHSVALEASERENKAHNVQMAALNRQISGLDSIKSVCFDYMHSLTKSSQKKIVAKSKSSHPLYNSWRRARV